MSIEEGRARAARPSLCALGLLLSVTFLAALAAPVTPASAASKPILLGTNPTSPGASLTPRIRGDADGVVTSVVRAGGLGPVGRELEPGTTIAIYTDEECAGPVAATGTPEELEGPGILVGEPVPADSETTFYATASDLGGTSGCSNGIVYQQVTTPPSPPTFTGVSPASGRERELPAPDRQLRSELGGLHLRRPGLRRRPCSPPAAPRASPRAASRSTSKTTPPPPSTRWPRSPGSPPAARAPPSPTRR